MRYPCYPRHNPCCNTAHHSLYPDTDTDKTVPPCRSCAHPLLGMKTDIGKVEVESEPRRYGPGLSAKAATDTCIKTKSARSTFGPLDTLPPLLPFVLTCLLTMAASRATRVNSSGQVRPFMPPIRPKPHPLPDHAYLHPPPKSNVEQGRALPPIHALNLDRKLEWGPEVRSILPPIK